MPRGLKSQEMLNTEECCLLKVRTVSSWEAREGDGMHCVITTSSPFRLACVLPPSTLPPAPSPATFPWPQHFHMQGWVLTAADLKGLESLTQLTHLHIKRSTNYPTGLRCLSALTNLRSALRLVRQLALAVLCDPENGLPT